MSIGLKSFLFFGVIALLLWLVGRWSNRTNMQWWGIGLAIYNCFVPLTWALLYLLYEFSPRAANDESTRALIFLLNITSAVWIVNWLRGKPSRWTPRLFIGGLVFLGLLGWRDIVM